MSKILTPKNAARIAVLFNSITCGESMIRKGYDYKLWQDHIGCAAVELRDNFGINVIGVESSVAFYEKRDSNVHFSQDQKDRLTAAT